MVWVCLQVWNQFGSYWRGRDWQSVPPLAMKWRVQFIDPLPPLANRWLSVTATRSRERGMRMETYAMCTKTVLSVSDTDQWSHPFCCSRPFSLIYSPSFLLAVFSWFLADFAANLWVSLWHCFSRKVGIEFGGTENGGHCNCYIEFTTFL